MTARELTDAEYRALNAAIQQHYGNNIATADSRDQLMYSFGLAAGCRAVLAAGVAREPTQELRNIVNAERFNREVFRDDAEFADWVQSRARYTLHLNDAAPREPVPEPVRECYGCSSPHTCATRGCTREGGGT